MTNSNPIHQIQDALLFLASRCDGAFKLDGQGFNGRDTKFGKSLAEQISNGRTLSDKQLRSARRMLNTYANSQLAPAGLSLPTQQELDGALSDPAPKAAGFSMICHDGAAYLSLKWDRSQVARYLPVLKREVPPQDMVWHAASASWTVDASYRDALEAALSAA